MSAEMVTTAISAVGLLLALAVGFGWMIHRTDGQIVGLRDEFRREFVKVRGEIAGVRDEARDEVAGMRDEFRSEITGLREEVGQLRSEVTDVKVSVARIEGRLDALVRPHEEERAVTSLQLR